MNVLHMHVGLGRRDLGQAWRPPRQPIDVGHAEVHAGFVRGGQEVQHGVGRAAHGDIQRHGVFERLEPGDGAGQHRDVVLLIVALRKIDDQVAGLQEQALPVLVGGERRAVAGQGQA